MGCCVQCWISNIFYLLDPIIKIQKRLNPTPRYRVANINHSSWVHLAAFIFPALLLSFLINIPKVVFGTTHLTEEQQSYIWSLWETFSTVFWDGAVHNHNAEREEREYDNGRLQHHPVEDRPRLHLLLHALVGKQNHYQLFLSNFKQTTNFIFWIPMKVQNQDEWGARWHIDRKTSNGICYIIVSIIFTTKQVGIPTRTPICACVVTRWSGPDSWRQATVVQTLCSRQRNISSTLDYGSYYCLLLATTCTSFTNS